MPFLIIARRVQDDDWSKSILAYEHATSYRVNVHMRVARSLCAEACPSSMAETANRGRVYFQPKSIRMGSGLKDATRVACAVEGAVITLP